jgi:hypothetical protein
MMGRAKILWTHTRDIEVEVSKALIKYRIPVYNEKTDIGNFVKAEKKDGMLNIYYQRNIPEDEKSEEDKFKISFADPPGTNEADLK